MALKMRAVFTHEGIKSSYAGALLIGEQEFCVHQFNGELKHTYRVGGTQAGLYFWVTIECVDDYPELKVVKCDHDAKPSPQSQQEHINHFKEVLKARFEYDEDLQNLVAPYLYRLVNCQPL